MPCTNDDFVLIIGHISVVFATWDLLTTLLIARLVKPEYPLADLVRKTLGQKLSFLEKLKHDEVIDTGPLDRIHAAAHAARAVSNERNCFIHDQWLFSPEAIERSEIGLCSIQVVMGVEGRTLTMKSKQYQIGDLRVFLGALRQQLKIFADFARELGPSK